MCPTMCRWPLGTTLWFPGGRGRKWLHNLLCWVGDGNWTEGKGIAAWVAGDKRKATAKPANFFCRNHHFFWELRCFGWVEEPRTRRLQSAPPPMPFRLRQQDVPQTCVSS